MTDPRSPATTAPATGQSGEQDGAGGRLARLWPLLRILGAALLVVLIVQQVEFAEFAPILSAAKLSFIALALLLTVLIRAAMAWRLQLAAHEFGLYPSYHAAFAILMSSSLAGFVLPGGLTQDVVRGVQLNSLFDQPRAALSAMLLDKYFGIIAILPIGVAALLVVGDLLPGVLHWLFYGALAGVTAATLFAGPVRDMLRARVPLPAKLEALLDIIATKLGLSASFAGLFSLSLVIQLLRCLSIVALFYAFSVEINPLLAFIYVPIVVVVIIAPISIGGLGVREGILLALFLPLGASAESLVLVGLGSMLIELATSLPGFYYVLRGLPRSVLERNQTSG